MVFALKCRTMIFYIKSLVAFHWKCAFWKVSVCNLITGKKAISVFFTHCFETTICCWIEDSCRYQFIFTNTFNLVFQMVAQVLQETSYLQMKLPTMRMMNCNMLGTSSLEMALSNENVEQQICRERTTFWKKYSVSNDNIELFICREQVIGKWHCQ